MTFSRREIHSQRASSNTCILLMLGDSFEVEAFDDREFSGLDAALDFAAVAFNHLPLGKPGEVSNMIDAFGGAQPGQFLVLTREGSAA